MFLRVSGVSGREFKNIFKKFNFFLFLPFRTSDLTLTLRLQRNAKNKPSRGQGHTSSYMPNTPGERFGLFLALRCWRNVKD